MYMNTFHYGYTYRTHVHVPTTHVHVHACLHMYIGRTCALQLDKPQSVVSLVEGVGPRDECGHRDAKIYPQH